MYFSQVTIVGQCNFEQALTHNEKSDIDGNALYVELQLLRQMLPGEKGKKKDLLMY